MKSKIFGSIILFLLFVIFLISLFCGQKIYTVLEITPDTKIAVDLNGNKKADDDEFFRLKDIVLFRTKYDEKASKYAYYYDLSLNEEITLGYVANEYLKYLLLNKKVEFADKIEPKNPNYSYRFAKIKINGSDVSEILLKNGLAFVYKDGNVSEYFSLESKKKIKQNAKFFKKLNLRVVNEKSKKFHRLDCPYAAKMRNPVLVPLSRIKNDFTHCKYCYVETILEEKTKTYIDKIESRQPSKSVGSIDLYLIDPNKYPRPSYRCRTSACQALLYNINNAKTSIDFAIYGIEGQNEIYKALLNAKKRGVNVRAVADSHPQKPDFYTDTNKLRKDFKAVSDNKSAIMHNKFFIFDNQKVMTGTMNISPTGSGGYNSNTFVAINSKAAANVYKKEFEQMYAGKFQKAKDENKLENLPLEGSTTLGIYFSPQTNIWINAIRPVISKAKKEIFVSAFYLTDKNLIEELTAAKKRGVNVLVIVDATGASNFKERVNMLRNEGIEVKVENWGGKNHDKTIVVDGCTFITGSANFSKSAFEKNDENIVIIKNCALGAFYRTHFLYLYNSIDNKYLKAYPKAEGFESRNSCFDGIDNDFDGKKDSQDNGCQRTFVK